MCLDFDPDNPEGTMPDAKTAEDVEVQPEIRLFCPHCKSDVTELPNFYRESVLWSGIKGDYFCSNCKNDITELKMGQLANLIESNIRPYSASDVAESCKQNNKREVRR